MAPHAPDHDAEQLAPLTAPPALPAPAPIGTTPTRPRPRPPPHRLLSASLWLANAGLPQPIWPADEAKLLPLPGGKPTKTKAERRRDKIIDALKPPYFILSVIIFNTCMYFWRSPDLQAQLEWAPSEWWLQPWRLLTYSWVHANDTHLMLNALLALVVGWRLEREQGAWQVCAVWWCGVAGGALGAGVLQPHVYVVGSSAAVYALLTAHLPNVCLRFGHIPLWWFRPLSVIVLLASEASWAATGGMGVAMVDAGQVAWSAHLAGAVFGVPVAFLVFTGEGKGKCYLRWSRWVSGITLAAMVGTAVVCTCLAPTPARPAPRELTVLSPRGPS